MHCFCYLDFKIAMTHRLPSIYLGRIDVSGSGRCLDWWKARVYSLLSGQVCHNKPCDCHSGHAEAHAQHDNCRRSVDCNTVARATHGLPPAGLVALPSMARAEPFDRLTKPALPGAGWE